jgi:hypothetical protein
MNAARVCAAKPLTVTDDAAEIVENRAPLASSLLSMVSRNLIVSFDQMTTFSPVLLPGAFACSTRAAPVRPVVVRAGARIRLADATGGTRGHPAEGLRRGDANGKPWCLMRMDSWPRRLPRVVVVTIGTALALAAQPAAASGRAVNGLQAIHSFGSLSEGIVRDASGKPEPFDLRISDPASVRVREDSLEVRSASRIQSEDPATRITDAIRHSGELTIEAWVRPAGTDQKGPARIFTISNDTSTRNVTLGQEGDRFDVRLRTTRTSENGLPSLSSSPGSAPIELTHVVYTRDRTGRTRIYINGRLDVEQTIPGSTSNWDDSCRIAIANEVSGDRPWRGSLHLIAIYSRDLLPMEVERHFAAGPNPRDDLASADASGKGDARATPESVAAAEGARFHQEIAPILTRHCLECHDATSRKGRLDLTRREAAFAGGRGGMAIVPFHSDKSLLWEYVASDEMPDGRPPLSEREKRAVREWIDAGAVWPVDVIDPVLYRRDGRTAGRWLRRLTVPEYIETVRSTVGVDIAEDARKLLPEDVRADGFSNTAYNLNVDLGHIEAYARLAAVIVERMDVRAFLSRHVRKEALDPAHLREIATEIGTWLLRGPLTEDEVDAYLDVATAFTDPVGEFTQILSSIIEAMLQSPRFIYLMESQVGDGTHWPVGDYELAARLSYMIWGAPPDRELMQAVEKGALYDRRGVAAHVRRMLSDPRAIERSVQFVHEWLDLGRLENLRPDPNLFPAWDPQLAADMREETLEFFREVAWRQARPLSDLLNARVTFATPQLAAHYGLTAGGEGLTRYDLSEVPGRGGLLTHGSTLTIGGDDASMVARGLFILHDLLRGVVNDPPPCVDTTPVPTQPGLTRRAIASARIANPSCGGCHRRFETLAFGLEKFDGIGAWHERDEHGNQLREDGTILFPGAADPVSYDSSGELMDLLAGSERVRETITWKVTQFALGRPLVPADAPALRKIHETAQENGGSYSNLITAIALSDLVQSIHTETFTANP